MTKEDAAASVANHIVDSLKSSPLIIGLLCLNGLFLALIAWLNHESASNRHDEMIEILRDCRPMNHSDQLGQRGKLADRLSDLKIP